MPRSIDWSVYDRYEYSEGDGQYLDEESLYEGVIVTTDRRQPFINTKHPNGQHLLNVAMHKHDKKSRSNSAVPCSQCREYKLIILTSHHGKETIPLCYACVDD